MKPVNIVEAIESEHFFQPIFGDLETWKNWIVCLKAIFAIPMTTEERKIYHTFTGRTKNPSKIFKEVFLIIGRRGGKSFISALIAVYLALFKDWTPYLKGGELGWIFIIASDRDQARVVHNHIKYMLEEQFKDVVTDSLKNQIYLTNNIVIEVRAASWRGLRGYTIVAAICDELGFWRSDESANPGKEVIEALMPGMATVKESMMIGISTPHARRGVLWDAFYNCYGKNDAHSLVWRAPTLSMNPTVDSRVVERAMEKDPSYARAEYFAEFRKDVESPFDPEDIASVIVDGRKALLPIPGVQYKAFADPSGGKVDSYTLGIAHGEKDVVVLDRLEEVKAPYDPKVITLRFSQILKDYRCHQVQGDKFAGNWVSSEFRKHGIKYLPISKTKSDLYSIFQSMMMSKGVELLDSERMKTQLQNLERRVHTGGRDTIDHPRGLHDDVANAAAGASVIMFHDLRIGLTEEFMAQRLPTVAGKTYRSREEETEDARQERRVMERLKDEGVI